MCDKCPTPVELFQRIDDAIDRGRWLLTGVPEGPPGQSRWLYTVGLAEQFRHPELVLVGACCGPCAGGILNWLGDRVAAGERLDRATEVPLFAEAGGLAHLRPVPKACWDSEWFAVWHSYYRTKPYDAPPAKAMQVVIADRHGRFPWEPGADPVLALTQQMPDAPVDDSRPNRAARRRARYHR